MRLSNLMALVGILILSGCQTSPNWITARGTAAALNSPASQQAVPAADLKKLAYLTVTSIRLVPDYVDPGHAFSVKVLIRNEGESESRPFEVEAQANLVTKNTVQSYPVGGKEVITIRPHQVALVTMTRNEGLNVPGLYTITVSLHKANLEIPGAADRFNPGIPEKPLIVKQY